MFRIIARRTLSTATKGTTAQNAVGSGKEKNWTHVVGTDKWVKVDATETSQLIIDLLKKQEQAKAAEKVGQDQLATEKLRKEVENEQLQEILQLLKKQPDNSAHKIMATKTGGLLVAGFMGLTFLTVITLIDP